MKAPCILCREAGSDTAAACWMGNCQAKQLRLALGQGQLPPRRHDRGWPHG